MISSFHSDGAIDFSSASAPVARPQNVPSGRFCPRCGEPTVRGKIADGYSSVFIPDHQRNPFALNTGVPVTAYACNHCGLLRIALAEEEQVKLNTLVAPGTFWLEVGRLIGRIRNRLPWRRRRSILTAAKPAIETK